jgi:hypothetical protein
VDITDEKGNRISRKGNKYYINGKPMKAFGNAKTNVTSLFPIKLKEINFQKQLDPHFLLLETGGSVAKKFSKLLGMEEQELILKQIKLDISETNNEIKRLEKNNEKHKETLNELKNVPALVKQAKELKLLDKTVSDYEKSAHLLDELVVAFSNIENKKWKYRNIGKYNDKFSIIYNKHLESLSGEKNVQELKEMLDYLSKVTEKKKKLNKKELMFCLNKVKGLEKTNVEIFETEKTIETLNRQTNMLIELKKKKENIYRNIKIAKKDVHNAFKELGYCPLCERKI